MQGILCRIVERRQTRMDNGCARRAWVHDRRPGMNGRTYCDGTICRRQVQLVGNPRRHANCTGGGTQRLLTDQWPGLGKLRWIDPLNGAGHRSRACHHAGGHDGGGASIDEIIERDVTVDRGEVGHLSHVDLAEVAITGVIPWMVWLVWPQWNPADMPPAECSADAEANADANKGYEGRRIDR